MYPGIPAGVYCGMLFLSTVAYSLPCTGGWPWDPFVPPMERPSVCTVGLPCVYRGISSHVPWCARVCPVGCRTVGFPCVYRGMLYRGIPLCVPWHAVPWDTFVCTVACCTVGYLCVYRGMLYRGIPWCAPWHAVPWDTFVCTVRYLLCVPWDALVCPVMLLGVP